MQRKTIDLVELTRLHGEGLSDAALARHFQTTGPTIRKRRDELHLMSNRPDCSKSGASQKIIEYLEQRGGISDFKSIREELGAGPHIHHYSKRLHQIRVPNLATVVYLDNREEQAKHLLEQLASSRQQAARERDYGQPVVDYVISNNGVVEPAQIQAVFKRHRIKRAFGSGRLKRLCAPDGRPALVYAVGFEEQARAAYQALVEQHWLGEEVRAEVRAKRVAPEYDFVTLEELASAIEISVQRETGHEIKAEHAKQIAEYVKNFFGYSDRIIDNHLEFDDRLLFRMLEEDFGILKTESEPAPMLINGFENWRTPYWILDKKHVRKILSETTAPAKTEDEATRLYKQAFVEIGSRPERDLDYKLREAKA